jgi:protein phosphatase
MSGSGIIRYRMQVRAGIEIASLSDVGCQRENNEDRHSYWEPAVDEQLPRKGRLAIVADGMGGHKGGQEASRIAVESIEESYSAAGEGNPQDLLVASFRVAHQRIQQYARAHPALLGMGTTATAILIFPTYLLYAHVGDSRLYRVHGSNITRLTHDHSYVGRLVEGGMISAEDADHHPQRHILTAALGAGPDVEPEVSGATIPLDAGDVLVLCTDGLWSLMADEEIYQTVTTHVPSEACRLLIELAKQRGGPDNITVQLLRIC